MTKHSVILLLVLLATLPTTAQNTVPPPTQFIKAQVAALTSPAMHGRGYVQDGGALASAFIQRKFTEYHLSPVIPGGVWIQGYSFPVNTFPGTMSLRINNKYLVPGADFLIDASSVSFRSDGMEVREMDMADITDRKQLRKKISKLSPRYAWALYNTDSCRKILKIGASEFAAMLPAGCYILPQKSKLTWTVASDTIAATIFYVKQDALPQNMTSVSASVTALFLPKSHNENIIGAIAGEVRDTFIALSAHYDHLGMMGDSTMFPGASDNASGMAMLLYLAAYYSTHPTHYSILFIAFSGEEAGLLGSAYYIAHPVIPLSNIRFLTNIDIMGDATDGVTVVNATEYPKQFELLQQINGQHKYLPIIKSRGEAANSDHYHFSEAGVPSFFFYSNGGKGYYHDIYDKGSELSLNNIEGVANLLLDFLREIN